MEEYRAEEGGDTRFDEARWRRVGADGDDLDRLRKRHVKLAVDSRARENRRVRSLPDSELRSELEGGRRVQLPKLPEHDPADTVSADDPAPELNVEGPVNEGGSTE